MHWTISNLKKDLEKAIGSLDLVEKNLSDYEKQIAELKVENWKDTTLQEMKKEYDEMEADYWRGFPISKDEQKVIKEWQHKHINKIHNGNFYGGVSGGSWRYEFVPTTIGVIGSICCASCYQKMLEELGNRADYETSFDYYGKQQGLTEKYDCKYVFSDII